MPKPNVKQYESLADAFTPGDTEIWYFNSEFGRDAMMGVEWLRDRNRLPVTESQIHKHYVKLGTVNLTNLERIFHAFNFWSPNGEAYTLIAGLDLHTSMSVGDIVKLDGKYHMCDRFGFVELELGE